VRLADQLKFYKNRAVKHEKKLKAIQWTIFIIGGLGTLLAAVNQQVWIALTTAVAAALTTYLSYQQTESTLTKYNQAFTDLENVKLWWSALPADEQAKQESVDALVDHTEKVLQSELDGWVQQMQNALAELRKGQAQATEREDGEGGGGAPAPTATSGAGGATGAGPEDDQTAAVAPEESPAATEAGTEEPATDEVSPGEATLGDNLGSDETTEVSPTEPGSGDDTAEADATTDVSNDKTDDAEGDSEELDSSEPESTTEGESGNSG